MDDHYLPPVEFLRECFSYDPATGDIRWKARPPHHFSRDADFRTWNAQNAGNLAFQGREDDGYGRSEFRYEGKRYRTRSSRVAFKLMTGEEPEQVDHWNGDETDDRWENLRAATNTDNARNKIGKAGKVLPKGVFLEGRKFVASLNVGSRRHRIGTYDTPVEAHAAYCAEAKERHGEFFNPGPHRPSVFD
jgi:hypothetical protein